MIQFYCAQCDKALDTNGRVWDLDTDTFTTIMDDEGNVYCSSDCKQKRAD